MSERNSIINNLTEGPLTKQLLLFSLPVVLGNLLHTLYNLVDMAVVGQFVGSIGLSAVAVSGQITFLLYALGIGFGSGGQILIAQQVGAQDEQGMSRTFGTSFTFTIFLGLAVAALGIIFNRPLLHLLNTPEEAMQDAYAYMFWCCLGIPFTYMLGGMCALLRGIGDSKHPTVFIAVSAVTNVALDLLLVAVFDMRAMGAAIATSAAQAAGCVWCLVYLYRHRDELGFRLAKEDFHIHKRTLSTILRLAAPLAFQSIAINISMMFVNAWVNAYGVIASAVNGVGSKLYSLMNVVTGAMQSAVATFVGQNIAAGKQDRVRRSMTVATACCVIFWLLTSILCFAVPRGVFRAFTQEAEVLALAPDYMHIQFWMYLTFALMSPPIGFINGVGNVGLNLAVAIADGVVARIGLSLLFAVTFGMGLYGYWWASAAAGFVSVFAGWIYYFSGRWKTRKLLTE